jgi:hypothetical protein
MKVKPLLRILKSMMRKTVCLGVFVLLAGCGGNVAQTTQEKELQRARTSWAAKNLRSYKFTVRKVCFCPEEYTRPVTITVRDGVATDSPDHLRAYDTVEKLLGTLETALASKADQVDMSFTGDGWPSSFYIDQSRAIADEEYSIAVTDLTPL